MAGRKIYRSTMGEEKIKKKYQELLRHWPVEKRELCLDTSLGPTFVIASGNEGKPPLILLHGACGNSIMWLKQIQSYLQNYRIFAIDIVGEPNLSINERPKTQGQVYVQWLEEICQQLELKQISIVGFSLGAWIACQFTAKHPDRIDRLALLSPSGVVKLRKRLRFKYFLVTLCMGPWGRRWLLRRLMQKQADVNTAELTELTIRYFKPRSWALPRLFKQAMPPLYCPVLVMLGGKDAFYSPDKILRRLVRQIPQMELIWRPKEGHFLGDFTREVERFLVTEFAPD